MKFWAEAGVEVKQLKLEMPLHSLHHEYWRQSSLLKGIVFVQMPTKAWLA